MIFLSLLMGYLRNTSLSRTLLFWELLLELPDKIWKSNFSEQEKLDLTHLAYFCKLPELNSFKERELNGIINDSVIARKILHRLYQRVRPKRPITVVFHRGYKDHGTLRPFHCWTPKFDESLTRLQLEIEERRLREEFLQLLVRKGKKPYSSKYLLEQKLFG